jgi:NADH dehydrogenase/NADH:ubiquinone oxidoreductase subunit G
MGNNKNNMYSFKDFLTVDYTGTDDELLALAAKKRKKADEEVGEAFTMAQRMKARQNFRKIKAKVAMGRKKAARRFATPEKLKDRAQKQARAAVLKKILKKDKSELSYGERQNAEKVLARKKGAIDRLAKKMLRTVRQKDRDKFKKTSDSE